jgi:DNA-binding protein H-NS
MADFNLEARSLKDLRQLQKNLARAVSSYDDRQRAEAQTKLYGISIAEV